MRETTRAIVQATLVSGGLTTAAAGIQTWVMSGNPSDAIFRSIASGPFGDDMNTGGAGATAAGLLVHFALTAAMVAAFMLAARRDPERLLRRPAVVGILYGFLLYIVMYWIVLPFRSPERYPSVAPLGTSLMIVYHTVLFGLPMALIAARALRPRPAADTRRRAF